MSTTNHTAPVTSTNEQSGNGHGAPAASAGLAAAIAMAITQIVSWFFGPDSAGDALLQGLSLSAVAFGGTYAGAFFAGRARRNR